jgi:TnsA endonuclease N terminal
MANYAQGIFVPTNPKKYIGKHDPKYRSGWEFTFMQFCDRNKNIIQWSSESIVIPYIHPLTGKRTNYIPDFLVVYENKHGQQKAEIVEIKPKKQSLIESRMTAQNRAVVAVNHAKWASAMAFCRQNGLTFRVITEDDLFYQGKKK